MGHRVHPQGPPAATGAGLPRVRPTAVRVATRWPAYPQLSPVSALQCAHNALPPETSGPHSSAATTPAAQVPRSAALTPVCSTTPASQPSPSMDRKQQLPLPRCREVFLRHLSAAPHLQASHLYLCIDSNKYRCTGVDKCCFNTFLQHHTCEATISIYGLTPVCSITPARLHYPSMEKQLLINTSLNHRICLNNQYFV